MPLRQLRGGGLLPDHVLVLDLELGFLGPDSAHGALVRHTATLRAVRAVRILVSLSVVVIILGLPVAEVVLGVIENLAGLAGVVVLGLGVAGHNRGVVEKLEQAAAVLGQNNLLLGALNGGGKLGLVGFLELLASLWAGVVSP